MTPSDSKFTHDVLWNVVSLGVAGVSGIALNILIGLLYDASALGVFNQVFAAYIFFSQIAALGVHHSALQEIAATSDPRERAAATTSALSVAIVLGSVLGVAFVLAAPLTSAILDSPDVGVGMLYAAPALVFFALDKITLGCLNGARRMRWYALLQGARVVLMLVAFAGCIIADASSASLPIVLSIAEGVTFLISLVAIRDLLTRIELGELWSRARRHIAFGLKGFGSGMLAELNTRVDVLMLGGFASDAIVGIYSFAAIVAEGMFQLLVVLRSNYAPLSARLYAENKTEELLAMIRRGRNRTYLAAIGVTGAAIAVYTFVAPVFVSAPVVTESASIFAILLVGMFVASGYVPFSQILLHARHPGWHTLLMLGTVVINIAANAVLITVLGPEGAALATAIALVAMILILLVLARKLLKLPI